MAIETLRVDTGALLHAFTAEANAPAASVLSGEERTKQTLHTRIAAGICDQLRVTVELNAPGLLGAGRRRRFDLEIALAGWVGPVLSDHRAGTGLGRTGASGKYEDTRCVMPAFTGSPFPIPTPLQHKRLRLRCKRAANLS